MVQGLIGGRRGLRWARVLRRLLGVSDAICVMGGVFFLIRVLWGFEALIRAAIDDLSVGVGDHKFTRVIGGVCWFFGIRIELS